jgi:hypothetical protein
MPIILITYLNFILCPLSTTDFQLWASFPPTTQHSLGSFLPHPADLETTNEDKINFYSK